MNTTGVFLAVIGVLMVLFLRWFIHGVEKAQRQSENAKRLRESSFRSSTFKWPDL